MTAAYTNELISQDQNAEKTNAVVNKRSDDKKDQMQIEDTSEFTSTEMPKSATGGRNHVEDFTDKKNGLPLRKIFIEKDDDTVANEKSSDCSELLEKNDNISLKVYVDEIDDIVQNESEKKELDNCGTCASKFSSKSMLSSTVCTFLGENGSQDTMLETRGVSSSRKDNFELQEIQNCIGNIATEINNFNVKIRNGLDGITLQDNVQETGDSQSELSFHEAVRAGDVKYIETLLASNSVQNLDEPDWNVSGDPPLLVAATNHCLPVLSLLLANGCDPAVRSPRGETALHRVILNGGPGNVLQFVKELIKYGCPAGVKEAGGGLTALHILSRQLAHAQGSKNLQHNFETALKTLDMLARAGPVNAKDHQGRNALHILASSTVFDNNHTAETKSLIETLLTSGADPSLKNDRGETPLHESLECGALNTAFLLIPHTPTGIMSRYGETPLHIASRKNYTDMVEKLLEHGEDPSVQDAGGNTPLHLASARGFHQTVSLLVTSPLAQLEQLNTEGLTALQVAAESGFVNAVRLLLKAGADPSQTVHYCNTILHRHPDITVLIDHELSRRRQLAA